MARIRAGAPVGHARPSLTRLWKLVNDNNHGCYDAYQQRTTRPISLVALNPA